MQVASLPLDLVSTKVPLISCSTHSAKLQLIQKAVVVAVIVNLVYIKETEEEEYARDKSSKRPPPQFFSNFSVPKRGGEVAHFPKLMIHITAYALLP